MKKIIKIAVIILSIFSSVFMSVSAEDSDFSVADAIREITGRNDPEVLEKLTEAQAVVAQKIVDSQVAYARLMHNRKISQQTQDEWFEKGTMDPNLTFKMYPLKMLKYTKQYAEYSCFNDILSIEPLWTVTTKSGGIFYYNMEYGEERPYLLSGVDASTSMLLADKETGEFLSDTESIEAMVKEEIDEEIVDCKIVGIPSVASFIYLKGTEKDYGIIIYLKDYFKEEESAIDEFKIFTVEEVMNSIGEFDTRLLAQALIEKPVYETEITALMEDGLIAGTDKGAEPLKPLSRIEATAILVRILGLEDEATSQTSYFADIASDNWGAKYANIAYDAGIAAGVGDNQFAPDELITSSQFASLLLRSQNQPNDWQTAINTFVEQGIITQEQADKMDLFTRGDMAKIIYELRENGLL